LSSEIEQELLKKIEILETQIKELKNSEIDESRIFSFSKIKESQLEKLFSIKQKIDRKRFGFWFENEIEISENDEKFLEDLIDENLDLINLYHEEDLKINFIAPILKRVNFFLIENEIRGFFDEKINYTTEEFTLKGEVDFTVSKGLRRAEKPFFFIQEFKRAEDFSNPRPQLLAELVAGVEINKTNLIKGAYVIGENWNFVILEKISANSYVYFISKTFNSTNISDLIKIYKNLLFVKNEIIQTTLKEN
jgi:hypothetical protein